MKKSKSILQPIKLNQKILFFDAAQTWFDAHVESLFHYNTNDKKIVLLVGSKKTIKTTLEKIKNLGQKK